jgi:CRP-like cAMP-binding protein
VSVRKINSAGEVIELAKLRKGRAFGEMAVLDGERRSASCIAVSDCSLLILAKDSLDKMLGEAPKTAAKVIRAIAVAMSRRLRMADGQLVEQQL